MSSLRKHAYRHEGLPVAYTDEVTEEQVRKINDLVSEEFKTGNWETVEQDS